MTDKQPQTPQERQAEFLKRLNELQDEFKIQLIPIVKTYPDGRQVPDLELVIQK